MKSMRDRTAVAAAVILAVGGLALWGCGGGKSAQTGESTGAGTQAQAPATGESADAGGGGVVSLAAGRQIFQERCSMCHGPDGRGDGPAGQTLNPKPRNFHDAAYMNGLTDQYIHDTILNGKPGTAMPAHRGLLSESQVRSVMLVVRSFAKQP